MKHISMIIKLNLIFLTFFAFSTTAAYSQKKCDSLFLKAASYQQKNMRKEAIKEYRNYFQSCDTLKYESDAYINIGVCFYSLNLKDSAAANFKRAFDVSKNKSTTMKHYADFFLHIREYDTLSKICKRLIEIDSNNSDAYFYAARSIWLARLAIMKRNNVEDFAQDTAMQSHLKKEIFYYYDKAIAIDSAKNYKMYKARTEQEAANDNQSNYDYYSSRAIFRENFIEGDGALHDWEMSILIHPTIFAYEHAAYTARYVGQKEKACNYIQTWAHMIPYPPTNDSSSDVFQKVDIAKKFCSELGITIKE